MADLEYDRAGIVEPPGIVEIKARLIETRLSDVLPASSSDIDSPPDCEAPNWLRAALAPSTISFPRKPLLSPQSFTPPMPEVE